MEGNHQFNTISTIDDNNQPIGHHHHHHHHHGQHENSEISSSLDDDVHEKKVPKLQSQRITYPILSGSVLSGQPPTSASINLYPSTIVRSEINTSIPSSKTANGATLPAPADVDVPSHPNQLFHTVPQFSYNHGILLQPTSLRPISATVTGASERSQNINLATGLISLSQVNKIFLNRSQDKCKDGGVSLYKYSLCDEAGYKLYTANEEYFAWKKYGQGCQQKLMVNICDHEGKEVIKATRELTFADYEMMVEASVGEVCGYVRKTDRGFIILDSNKDRVLNIREAMSPLCVCGSFDSKVISLDGSIIGLLTWQSMYNESTVTFPKDLELRMKAILLSFSILNNSHRGMF